MSKEHKNGKLYVVSGPSGAGKGTICKEIASREQVEISISMTTREPRTGEVDGKDYYFVSKEEFEESVAQNNLLEWASVHGNFYGTPKDAVMKRIERGRNVILEIDVQGGLQVKKAMPETVLVFILPPSISELRQRLTGRGTDAKDVIERRMNQAINEIKLIGEYDYYIVNNEVEGAVEDLQAIINAEASKVPSKVRPIISRYENEEGK